ncbi:MAG: hypothetical protein CMQ41_16105 [Gammaproteobacteria bacterium]|nr:hypothetical protein [Gammaproteobacteria bacterium]
MVACFAIAVHPVQSWRTCKAGERLHPYNFCEKCTKGYPQDFWYMDESNHNHEDCKYCPPPKLVTQGGKACIKAPTHHPTHHPTPADEPTWQPTASPSRAPTDVIRIFSVEDIVGWLIDTPARMRIWGKYFTQHFSRDEITGECFMSAFHGNSRARAALVDELKTTGRW